MARPGTFPPGVSGNPKGRPKKNRALTDILEKAGSSTVEIDGKKISGKRLIAKLLWEVALLGECTLPNGATVTVNSDGWFDVVRFIYNQIDGPPKHDISLEHSGEIDIAGIREQLLSKFDTIASTIAAQPIPAEPDE